MQFKKDDIVVYKNYGVCKIKSISFLSFSSDRKKENYYVLSPLGSPNSTYYIPVCGAESSLRAPLTKEAARKLTETSKTIDLEWPENRQCRSGFFNSILSKGICPELVALIALLTDRQAELQKLNKLLSSGDEIILSKAKKLLDEELSVSLSIPKEEVISLFS